MKNFVQIPPRKLCAGNEGGPLTPQITPLLLLTHENERISIFSSLKLPLLYPLLTLSNKVMVLKILDSTDLKENVSG